MDLATLLSKLPAPAQRGIETLNFTELEDFTSVSEAQVQSLHGIGPKTVSLIKDTLAKQGLTFQAWTEGKTVLSDPNIYPDDNELIHHLGKAKDLLDQMIDEFRRCTPPISLEWRYYTDGNTWLGKSTAKNKTVIWVTVCHHMYKTTFYFRLNAVPLLEQSGLGDQYRSQWKEIEATGKTKAVTVEVDGPQKLDHVRLLVRIKLLLI